MIDQETVTASERLVWAKLTLTRMLEKELVVLHLKVSWRSWPCVRSGLGLWNSMQVMPFQSAALTAWASSAMLGDVWGWGEVNGGRGGGKKETEVEQFSR